MMATSLPQRFEVSPPVIWAPLSMILLAGVLPLAAIGYTLLRGPAQSEAARWGMAYPAGFVLVLLIALLLLMRRRAVAWQNGVLSIRAALYTKRIAASELDLERARVVDLEERTELRPWLKSNGYSTIGFSAGHFRMRNGLGSVFCLLTQRQRVLWLPQRDGKHHLLLSLERPQALLDALRRA